METEHVPCVDPDYSDLIGKRPPNGPVIEFQSCPCGLMVCAGPCDECIQLRDRTRHGEAPSIPAGARDNKPLVLAGLLAFGTLVFLAESIATGTPRPSDITQGLD